MRALLIAGCLLGACYDDAPGLRLVIHDPGFDAVRVELFIAPAKCGDMCGRSIAPNAPPAGSTVRQRLMGEVFYLDGPADGVTPSTSIDLVDGRAVFDLRSESTSDASDVKYVVVVAFDASDNAIAYGVLHDARIPAHDTVAYRVELEPATLTPSSNAVMPQGSRIWLWRKQDASAACLGIEVSNGRDTVERKWFVPKNDSDCDEVMPECDDYFYRANGSVEGLGAPDARCIVPRNSGLPCLAGVRSCVDGAGDGSCVALAEPRYCLAQGVCNPDACLTSPLACSSNGLSTTVLCPVPINQNGGRCDPGSAAGDGPIVLDLSPFFQTSCTGAAFTSLRVDQGINATASFQPVNTATLAISPLDANTCKFALDFTGQIDFVEPGMPRSIAYALDVTLGTDHVVLPIVFSTVLNQCDAIADCDLVMPSGGTEHLDYCN